MTKLQVESFPGSAAARSEQLERDAQHIASVVFAQQDKWQAAIDGMLGVKAARSSGVRPFSGLREAYTCFA